jgi:hypothetical protein
VAERGTVTGRVRGADDAGVLLEVGGEEQKFDYEVLGAGQVQVEFSRQEDDA